MTSYLRMLRYAPLVAVLAACTPSESETGEVDFDEVLSQVEVPAEHAAGQALFTTNCAACHGPLGLGTDTGPPLVHIIYESSHHADVAFVIAAERGVRAHHWGFGDMPPVPGVTRDQLAEVVGYVRFLQRQVGIN